MKKLLIFLLIPLMLVTAYGQESPPVEDMKGFEYIDMKSDFDLLVEYTFLNPECTSGDQYYYSIIIGTAVVGENFDRISVLIPCLGNEFQRGDLVVIKPMPVPTGNIVYAIRNYKKDGVDVSDIFGSEFPAVWGNVVEVL